MTRALAFFAQLVLWAAVALIAATVFARSHNQPQGSACFVLMAANQVPSPESSGTISRALKPNLPERSEIKC